MHVEDDEFTVAYNPARIDEKSLIAAVKEIGYRSDVVTERNAGPDEQVTETVDEQAEPPFFTEALAKAKADGKPLVLDFTAAWCAPCQKMKQETFPDERVAPLLKRFIVIEVDTDRYPGLAKKLGVVGLPDIRLLSLDGSTEKKLLGYHTPEQFAAVLGRFLETYRDGR